MSYRQSEAASREFLRVTFTDVSESERKRVRRALENYCGQDTDDSRYDVLLWIGVPKGQKPPIAGNRAYPGLLLAIKEVS